MRDPRVDEICHQVRNAVLVTKSIAGRIQTGMKAGSMAPEEAAELARELMVRYADIERILESLTCDSGKEENP